MLGAQESWKGKERLCFTEFLFSPFSPSPFFKRIFFILRISQHMFHSPPSSLPLFFLSPFAPLTLINHKRMCFAISFVSFLLHHLYLQWVSFSPSFIFSTQSCPLFPPVFPRLFSLSVFILFASELHTKVLTRQNLTP